MEHFWSWAAPGLWTTELSYASNLKILSNSLPKVEKSSLTQNPAPGVSWIKVPSSLGFPSGAPYLMKSPAIWKFSSGGPKRP